MEEGDREPVKNLHSVLWRWELLQKFKQNKNKYTNLSLENHPSYHSPHPELVLLNYILYVSLFSISPQIDEPPLMKTPLALVI